MSERRFPDLDVLVADGRAQGYAGAPGGAPPHETMPGGTMPGGPMPGGMLAYEDGDPGLCALYAYPARVHEGVPVVRANMVATVDGAAWGDDGRSGSINGAADHRVFRVLRALADVVLVGAGTARAEGYGPLSVDADLLPSRAATGPSTRLEVAVVTRTGDLPAGLATVTGDEVPYVLTSARGAASLPRHVPAERVLVLGEDDVDVVAGVRALAARGLPRVLCEGGPRLLGTLLAAGAVDELCQTTSPLVVGGSASRTVVSPDPLEDTTARLDLLLHSRGVLLARWGLRTEP